MGSSYFLAVAALVQFTPAIWAHPSSLECATDATTRLVPGRDDIMEGPATAQPPGFGMSAALKSSSATQYTVTITSPRSVYFAARVMGGGILTPRAIDSKMLNNTANCTAQVYTSNMIQKDNSNFTLDISKASPGVYVIVGFTDGSSGPGIYVVNSTSPTPPPPPPPQHAP